MCSPSRRPRREHALPPHHHLSKRVPTTKTIPLPAPAATAASFCVFTDASATTVACATSAPSYLQTCATRLGANPSGTRCCRSLILRVHQHVSHADGLPCLRTSSSLSVRHPTRGQLVRRSFISRVHQHVSHADGVRCLRTFISSRACYPTRCEPIWHPMLP